MNCPLCAQPMAATVSTGAVRVPVWACPDCDTAMPRLPQAEHVRQGILPHLQPGRQSRQVVYTEEEVEGQTDGSCARYGWPNLSTVRRVKFVACPRCRVRFRPPGNDGADRGVPDRIIMPPWLPGGLGILVELKGTRGRYSSIEQRDLCESGRIAVARSGLEVEAIVERLRRELGR